MTTDRSKYLLWCSSSQYCLLRYPVLWLSEFVTQRPIWNLYFRSILQGHITGCLQYTQNLWPYKVKYTAEIIEGYASFSMAIFWENTPCEHKFGVHKISWCVKDQENSYKLLTKWYKTPDKIALYHIANQSEKCWRCLEGEGDLFHIWYAISAMKSL